MAQLEEAPVVACAPIQFLVSDLSTKPTKGVGELALDLSGRQNTELFIGSLLRALQLDQLSNLTA